jgi:formiminoglutamase
MISLVDFLSPVDAEKIKPVNGFTPSQLGYITDIYSVNFPSLRGVDIALIGVEDDRNAIHNEGCAKAPDEVRKQLYQLHEGSFKLRMIDLGNIKAGASVRDTYIALKTVVEELIRNKIVPVIIGGGQDLTYAQYLAYENLEQKVDLVVVDSHFDLNPEVESEATSSSYLHNIILHEPGYLFNYSNIGFQTYFVSQESIRLMQKLYFDVHRLGEMSGKISEAEPVIRNADLLSFDISAIRKSDAPGNANANPNGFYGEDACQIARYAGMNDKLTSIGLYEMNPKYDEHHQTAMLLSQMIWCFIEGYYSRKNDRPLTSKSDFVKYRATFKDSDHEVIFYKSKKTERWWMQIPYPNTKTKNERFHLVPCSYADYQTACGGEMPDRWWKNFQKLI